MTDAPDLPPEQDAVRRLLADARHDGATPPEVVARLDEALAGLVAERTSAPVTPADDRSPARVVDLGARRRRLAGAGLLAAAAVVVAGVAVGQVLPSGGGSDDSSASGSASSGDAGGGNTFSQQDSSGAEAAPSDEPDSLTSPDPKREITPQSGLPAVSTTDAALRQQLLTLRAGASRRLVALDDLAAASACRATDTGPGRRLPVEVDGQVGIVVYRAPTGTDQDAVLYVCGTPEPVGTVTLPAPSPAP